MSRYEAVFVKGDIGLEQLTKYGFKLNSGFPDSSVRAVWKPSYTVNQKEKKYYTEGEEYYIWISNQGQIIIRPNRWEQISAKIQTLLFDMFSDGILEKRKLRV